MVDPGFSVGGKVPIPLGAPTSDAGTFRQKRMRKRNNWVPLGGGTCAGSGLLYPLLL